jgi:hypothetical protein
MPTVSITENLKEVFKNNEITVLCSVVQNAENIFSGNLYVSNNLFDQQITNIKINLLVPKYVSPKVVSSPATHLEPKQSQGIKKEFVMTSSDTSKPIKIQIKYSYNVGNDPNEVNLKILNIDLG